MGETIDDDYDEKVTADPKHGITREQALARAFLAVWRETRERAIPLSIAWRVDSNVIADGLIALYQQAGS